MHLLIISESYKAGASLKVYLPEMTEVAFAESLQRSRTLAVSPIKKYMVVHIKVSGATPVVVDKNLSLGLLESLSKSG